MSDVARFDADILRPKGGRHVKDGSALVSGDQQENVRVCATCYLERYSDTKVIDPIKENFSSPLTITPAIMHSQEYAKEYLAHVSMIRDLFEQSSITLNQALLA